MPARCGVVQEREPHQWIDDKPSVASPDIIAIVDAGTGEAYPNNVVAAGGRAAIGTPA
jgi:DUF917 family protein